MSAKTCAINSFERTTGIKLKNATLRDIEEWNRALRENGMKDNTIASYRSMVSRLIIAQLQPRKTGVPCPLSEKQIKSMLGVAPETDRAWLAVALLAGPAATRWTWGNLYEGERAVPLSAYRILIDEALRRKMKTFPCPYRGDDDARWVNSRREPIWNLTQQQITSRLKNIARKAGIGISMNLATLGNIHQQLMERHETADKIAKALGIDPAKVAPKPKPKHSIGLIGSGRSPAFIERG